MFERPRYIDAALAKRALDYKWNEKLSYSFENRRDPKLKKLLLGMSPSAGNALVLGVVEWVHWRLAAEAKDDRLLHFIAASWVERVEPARTERAMWRGDRADPRKGVLRVTEQQTVIALAGGSEATSAEQHAIDVIALVRHVIDDVAFDRWLSAAGARLVKLFPRKTRFRKSEGYEVVEHGVVVPRAVLDPDFAYRPRDRESLVAKQTALAKQDNPLLAVAPRPAPSTMYTCAATLRAGGDGADAFGRAIALSADAATLVIGAPDEAVTHHGAGAVRVYAGAGAARTLVAPSPSLGAMFGAALALSKDASTLAIGAPREQTAGAVYVLAAPDWKLATRLAPAAATSDAEVGASIALSHDGSILAVGSPRASIGKLRGAGIVFVFERSGATWQKRAELAAAKPAAWAMFGAGVAISADGKTIVVGAPRRAHRKTEAAGAVYVFRKQGTKWTEQALLEPVKPQVHAELGACVALAADATVLAVGAANEDGFTTDSPSDDDARGRIGAVHVYRLVNDAWIHEARLQGTPRDEDNFFGQAIALSSDGRQLVVGAPNEGRTGAVFVFARAESWQQEAYLKPPDRVEHAPFGKAVAIDGRATTLVVGAPASIAAGCAHRFERV